MVNWCNDMEITEEKFKENLLSRLNDLNQGWVDGDIEDSRNKTVDLVNHELKITVEIKDCLRPEYEPVNHGRLQTANYDITIINDRLRNNIEVAERKFRQYEGYKTALLFRSSFPLPHILKESIDGIHTFRRGGVDEISCEGQFSSSENLSYIGRREKHQRTEIGCFLIFDNSGCFYFDNQYVKSKRLIVKDQIEKIFNLEFTYLK